MTMRDPTGAPGTAAATARPIRPTSHALTAPVAPLVWPGRYRVATTTAETADGIVITGPPPIRMTADNRRRGQVLLARVLVAARACRDRRWIAEPGGSGVSGPASRWRSCSPR